MNNNVIKTTVLVLAAAIGLSACATSQGSLTGATATESVASANNAATQDLPTSNLGPRQTTLVRRNDERATGGVEGRPNSSTIDSGRVRTSHSASF